MWSPAGARVDRGTRRRLVLQPTAMSGRPSQGLVLETVGVVRCSGLGSEDSRVPGHFWWTSGGPKKSRRSRCPKKHNSGRCQCAQQRWRCCRTRGSSVAWGSGCRNSGS